MLESKIASFSNLETRMTECHKNIKQAEELVIKHKKDFQVD
jgi:hypothetical protein